jgi:hypothetical protein
MSVADYGSASWGECARPLVHGHKIFNDGVVGVDLQAPTEDKGIRSLRPVQHLARVIPDAAPGTMKLPFASMVPSSPSTIQSYGRRLGLLRAGHPVRSHEV